MGIDSVCSNYIYVLLLLQICNFQYYIQIVCNTKAYIWLSLFMQTCILVMSMTRHLIPGRNRTFRLNISEMTTFEKSILVISWNPASYRCSESREFPQPGTRICAEEETSSSPAAVEADSGCASVDRWERRGWRSWGQSAYHSKESSLPRMLKNLSQFSLLVKSPRVFSSSSSCCCLSFFPIFFFSHSVFSSFVWGLCFKGFTLEGFTSGRSQEFDFRLKVY